MISSFMQNIGAAALFLPATMRVSKTLDIPLSRLLMPMGFLRYFGWNGNAGRFQSVDSVKTIFWQTLTWSLSGFFPVTPIGLLLVASGILYFMLFGKYVLPSRVGASGEEIGGALKNPWNIWRGCPGL